MTGGPSRGASPADLACSEGRHPGPPTSETPPPGSDRSSSHPLVYSRSGRMPRGSLDATRYLLVPVPSFPLAPLASCALSGRVQFPPGGRDAGALTEEECPRRSLMAHRGLAKAIKVCDCFRWRCREDGTFWGAVQSSPSGFCALHMNTPRPGRRKAGGLASKRERPSRPRGVPGVVATMVTPGPSHTSRELPAPLRCYTRDNSRGRHEVLPLYPAGLPLSS